jgi:hypothetical protein
MAKPAVKNPNIPISNRCDAGRFTGCGLSVASELPDGSGPPFNCGEAEQLEGPSFGQRNACVPHPQQETASSMFSRPQYSQVFISNLVAERAASSMRVSLGRGYTRFGTTVNSGNWATQKMRSMRCRTSPATTSNGSRRRRSYMRTSHQPSRRPF